MGNMLEGGRFIRESEDPDLREVNKDLLERANQLNILFESMQEHASQGDFEIVGAIEELMLRIAAGETFPPL